MEMRLLSTKAEQRIFVRRLQQARDQQLTHFEDVCDGRADNAARLAASELYGLFQNPGDGPEAMVAGMAIHDLEMFPRTCPGPDLSHWPKKAVFECSDHWSISRGAGMLMWHGAAIQIARRDPRAVLAYLAVGMSDHKGFYKAMGFVPFGWPAQFVYLRTEAGFPWVQPVILQGGALRRLIVGTSQLPFETEDDFITVQIGTSRSLRPAALPATTPAPQVFRHPHGAAHLAGGGFALEA